MPPYLYTEKTNIVVTDPDGKKFESSRRVRKQMPLWSLGLPLEQAKSVLLELLEQLGLVLN